MCHCPKHYGVHRYTDNIFGTVVETKYIIARAVILLDMPTLTPQTPVKDMV